MLKLKTTYNLESNIEKIDRTTEGSAILNKLLKEFGVYTHYIESRNIVEGLEAVVRFYIWSEDSLVKKLDLLFDTYRKINDFLMESQYYESLPEEDKKKLVDAFSSIYFSLKFILQDIYQIYKVIREKMEEEKRQKQITDKFQCFRKIIKKKIWNFGSISFFFI